MEFEALFQFFVQFVLGFSVFSLMFFIFFYKEYVGHLFDSRIDEKKSGLYLLQGYWIEKMGKFSEENSSKVKTGWQKIITWGMTSFIVSIVYISGHLVHSISDYLIDADRDMKGDFWGAIYPLSNEAVLREAIIFKKNKNPSGDSKICSPVENESWCLTSLGEHVANDYVDVYGKKLLGKVDFSEEIETTAGANYKWRRESFGKLKFRQDFSRHIYYQAVNYSQLNSTMSYQTLLWKQQAEYTSGVYFLVLMTFIFLSVIFLNKLKNLEKSKRLKFCLRISSGNMSYISRINKVTLFYWRFVRKNDMYRRLLFRAAFPLGVLLVMLLTIKFFIYPMAQLNFYERAIGFYASTLMIDHRNVGYTSPLPITLHVKFDEIGKPVEEGSRLTNR